MFDKDLSFANYYKICREIDVLANTLRICFLAIVAIAERCFLWLIGYMIGIASSLLSSQRRYKCLSLI